jgi:hypothetical protein
MGRNNDMRDVLMYTFAYVQSVSISFSKMRCTHLFMSKCNGRQKMTLNEFNVGRFLLSAQNLLSKKTCFLCAIV